MIRTEELLLLLEEGSGLWRVFGVYSPDSRLLALFVPPVMWVSSCEVLLRAR